MRPSLDRGRVVALVLALAAVGAMALAWATIPPPRRGFPASVRPVASDPLTAALVRCNSLGERALTDAGCRAAWDAHRRRFLEDARGPRS